MLPETWIEDLTLWGGAQRVISILANEYALRGWDVHIAFLLDFKIGYTIDKMVSLHDVPQEKKNITGLMKWIKELRKVIIEVSLDVIVSFVGRINIVTTLSTIGMKIPLIVSERNDPVNNRCYHGCRSIQCWSKWFFGYANRYERIGYIMVEHSRNGKGNGYKSLQCAYH